MASQALKILKQEAQKSNHIILALEERGFCVALQNESARTAESRAISDFCPMVKKASLAWIDFIVDDIGKDAIKNATELGFSELLVKNLLKNQRSGYEDFGNEMGLLLPAIHVEKFDVHLQPLLILIKKNLVVTLHTSELKRFFRIRRYAETLLKKMPKHVLQADKITLLLIRLIDESNSRNFDHLQLIEEHGDKLSQDMMEQNVSRAAVGKRIYEMKHALILYLSGLWATVDALNSMRYGDADLISDDPKILGRIGGLVSEVHAHIGLAEHLSDVLASGLEVLQSIYNNQLQILNNRLAMLVAYLTIIGTALLVPNTIATVMSNSAFNMGINDEAWYLTLILGSTVVATVLSWWVVKKMGLLPEKPDVG